MEITAATIKNLLQKILAAALLFGFFFGLLAVVFVPFELRDMAAAKEWPSRQGVITMSYASGVHSAGRAPYWRTEIGGKFLDNGEKFWITRVRYGDFRFGGGKAKANETAARYPIGKKVDVYYSPSNPKEKILEPFAPWTTMLVTLGVGVAFLLLPVLLYAFRKRPANEDSSQTRGT